MSMFSAIDKMTHAWYFTPFCAQPWSHPNFSHTIIVSKKLLTGVTLPGAHLVISVIFQETDSSLFMVHFNIRSRYMGEINGMKAAFQDSMEMLVKMLLNNLQTARDENGELLTGLRVSTTYTDAEIRPRVCSKHQ